MGKKKIKIKSKPVSLGEFLGTSASNTGGSAVIIAAKANWAEEGEEFEDDRFASERIVLPTAPRQARGAAVDVERIPENPPYIAYVANLPFEVEDEDIERFFSDLKIKSIRMPREGGEYGRFKGFGYVEFETRGDLIEALALNEDIMRNRKIRVDVAEEESSSGRRAGGSFTRGNREGGDDEREDRSGDVSDWRAASKTSDSYGSDRNSGGGRNFDSRSEDNGFGRDRYDRGGSRSDDGYGRGGFGRDRGDLDRGFRDRREGSNYDRGSRFGGGRFDDHSGGSGGRFRSNDNDDSDRWRNRNRERDEEPREPREAPKERPKLQLKPRSKQVETTDSGAPSSNTSIFGSARPVDTASRELEIEKKLTTKTPAQPQSPPRSRERSSKDIFGAAKPVDTAAKEKEIEEKLQNQNELRSTNKNVSTGKYVVRKNFHFDSENDNYRRDTRDKQDRDSYRSKSYNDNRDSQNTDRHNKDVQKEPAAEEKPCDKKKKEDVVLDTTNKFANLDILEDDDA